MRRRENKRSKAFARLGGEGALEEPKEAEDRGGTTTMTMVWEEEGFDSDATEVMY